MENKRPSIFMQMHNRTRTNEGSFNVGLQELFYTADQSNRRKLVKAFPEFFGEEVPEFGITKGDIHSKRVMYKNWLIKWDETIQLYALFTPEEMEQPAGYRQAEAELSSISDAKLFIDNY